MHAVWAFFLVLRWDELSIVKLGRKQELECPEAGESEAAMCLLLCGIRSQTVLPT